MIAEAHESDYVDADRVAAEIKFARRIFADNDWPVIDVTRRSIEAGSLLAVAKDVPRKVKEHLADVIQVQTIVTGCDRQISLLESDALAALNNAQCGVVDTHHIVIEVQERMSTVVALAVKQIEDYVDPAKVDDVGSVNGASA